MKPEERARQDIDKLLGAAGWNVQDYKNLNLGDMMTCIKAQKRRQGLREKTTEKI
jgi:hypothetical protein